MLRNINKVIFISRLRKTNIFDLNLVFFTGKYLHLRYNALCYLGYQIYSGSVIETF